MASYSGTEDEAQQLPDQGGHDESAPTLNWEEEGLLLLDSPGPRATSVTDSEATEDEDSQTVVRPTSPRGEVGSSQGGSAWSSTEAREDALKAHEDALEARERDEGARRRAGGARAW